MASEGAFFLTTAFIATYHLTPPTGNSQHGEMSMPTINQAWHEKHPLDPKARLEERIHWHLEHAKHCGCRPMPLDIRAAVKVMKQRRKAK